MDQLKGQISLFRKEDETSWSINVQTGGTEHGKIDAKMTQSETNTGNIIEKQVQVANKMGLHARPAMQFVDLANKFESRISVCKKKQCVNAKSIMELLLLAAGPGTILEIKAEGHDAKIAVEALVNLVESKFGEE